jgi:hypothetical protein
MVKKPCAAGFLDKGVDWMPFLEKLTAQDAAMLLIDHQTGTMLGVQDIRLDQFRSNVLALAKTAKAHDLHGVLCRRPERPSNA